MAIGNIVPKRKFAGNPNDPDYRKLVGHGWGVYAAHQFSVLTSLGLEPDDSLLDLGCGGLRGGRLFIAFLEKGNYYGIEPARWAIREAIEGELGREYIEKRKPSFDYNTEANLEVFGRKFDFILAHSIFVHAPKEWVGNCLLEAKKVLKRKGKFLATAVLRELDSGETTWDYPEPRYHSGKTLNLLAAEAGLKFEILKTRHPAAKILKQNKKWIMLTHAK